MSTTATAVQQTPVTTPSTIKMNSSFHPQGHPPSQPQQQAAPYQLQPGQQQQSLPAGAPSGPFPNPASVSPLVPFLFPRGGDIRFLTGNIVPSSWHTIFGCFRGLFWAICSSSSSLNSPLTLSSNSSLLSGLIR
ncbi:hypothetical protein M407DRAFT_96826 [Tulasnella calospora MUT 4182]|uniref:Uncharacterized protein n=1 Tax=Tulasnella calospora MUT 4182 TaxID=1051891 RepID=A0A0C3Q6E4_9AGAM|nr:hypothetical protein M407DRAFT_96826 [Tulasnella calospora MUT 4182]